MYTCYYMYFHEGMERQSVDAVESDAIASFFNGFWVNEDYEFTKGNDAKHFIPESAILKITKNNVE